LQDFFDDLGVVFERCFHAGDFGFGLFGMAEDLKPRPDHALSANPR